MVGQSPARGSYFVYESEPLDPVINSEQSGRSSSFLHGLTLETGGRLEQVPQEFAPKQTAASQPGQVCDSSHLERQCHARRYRKTLNS